MGQSEDFAGSLLGLGQVARSVAQVAEALLDVKSQGVVDFGGDVCFAQELP